MQVAEVLADAGVNLISMNIAETGDFGILRIVASDPDKAHEVLRSAGFALKKTDVIAFACPNEPGALLKILKRLSVEGVCIEGMQSFNNGTSAYVILRPIDVEACDKLLASWGIDLLTDADLYKI